MTQEQDQGFKKTNDVGVKRRGRARLHKPATINDLLLGIQEGLSRISKAKGTLEDIESGRVEDSRTEAVGILEYHLSELYFNLIGAFEILELSDSLKEIRTRWEGCVQNGLGKYTTDVYEGDLYIDCPAATVLQAGASIIELAVKHEHIKERREEQAEAEEQKEARVQRREQHAHEQATREEQHAHERRTLFISSAVGIITVLLSLAFGNCDKFVDVFQRSSSPTRPSLVYSGAIGLPENSKSALIKIVCEPSIEGVLAAAGSGRYTVTLLSQVPLPIDLFCRAEAPGLQSEPVYISVPTYPPPRGRRTPETHVPEIVLRPRSEPEQ